ncbi:unnamed protein product [Pleuronectes platessa]|uniref:Uncharacterized protein n=1 Tax=Pleuronectes platessa TaxID=8262 RepID=A0A9N7VB93_PLEPL|nr:unnamed protein product [Pleuronectes platessa]
MERSVFGPSDLRVPAGTNKLQTCFSISSSTLAGPSLRHRPYHYPHQLQKCLRNLGVGGISPASIREDGNVGITDTMKLVASVSTLESRRCLCASGRVAVEQIRETESRAGDEVEERTVQCGAQPTEEYRQEFAVSG